MDDNARLTVRGHHRNRRAGEPWRSSDQTENSDRVHLPPVGDDFGIEQLGLTPGREPGTQQSQHRVLGSGYMQEVDLLTLVKDVAAQFAQQVSSPEQSNKLAVGCGRPGGELLNKQ